MTYSSDTWVDGVFYDGWRLKASDLNANNQWLLAQISGGSGGATVSWTANAGEGIVVTGGPAFINLYNNGGPLGVQNANGTDDTRPVDGYATTGAAEGSPITVTLFGILIGGFTGLEPGLPVYLSTTDGQLTQTPPTSPSQQLGKALSATQILYNPGPMFG